MAANATITFLIQASVIVGLVPAVWYLLSIRRIMPLAIFQILAGIALGPSLLGRFQPELLNALFPPAGFMALATVANLGVVVFAFVLGLHLEPAALLTNRGRTFAAVSTGSIAVPTLCGAAVGLWIHRLFPGAIGPNASVSQFAAGIGICVGVTALPVLAAILIEMKLLRSGIGQQALGYAVVNDFVLWVMLACLLAVSAGQHQQGSVLWHLALGGAVYVAAVMFVLRPGLAMLSEKLEEPNLRLGLVCLVVFVSAGATDLLGLHAILGALVAGLIIPRDWRAGVLSNLETMTVVVLLPFFFTLTGLRTAIQVKSDAFWGILAISTVAASLGKIAGTALPARLSGQSWRESLALGALMQSKGLMEVVALTILLEAGIIAPVTFSAMIMMAVLTTLLAPLLTRLTLNAPVGSTAASPSAPAPDRAASSASRPVFPATYGGMTAPVVSAVIVSWNDWPKLQHCLASLLGSALTADAARATAALDVIVIDNNSVDGTPDRVAEHFPTVRLVRNADNIGHTRAVNQAFALASGEFVLVLDSDTELQPDCLDLLLRFARERPEFDLISPRTFNTDGSIQETARNFPTPMSALFGRQTVLSRIFPNNPFTDRYLGRDRSNDAVPFEVQQIGGACMFFRRSLLDQVGTWDESYFGYWVDTDWCHRLHQHGRRVVCVPTAWIYHHESNARGKRKSVSRIWIFYYGAWRLYTRWHTRGPWDPRALVAGASLVVIAGVKTCLNALPERAAGAAAQPLQRRASAFSGGSQQP